MKRPTITLCSILKNEKHNLLPLLESVEGCFDEIHLTDTGSTDGSVEYIKELAATGRWNIKLFHFDWVNDFAAARNYSFSHATTDYVAWADLDDSLDSAETFKLWRDSVMHTADYWLAVYHYAHNDKGEPVCSFARERVFRRANGFKWKYFVHEGVTPDSGSTPPNAINYAVTWSIRHRRSSADLAQDKSRNLALFEKNKDKLDARMKYYYGKELFENNKPLDAFTVLQDATVEKNLELHDRILGIQYLAMSCMQLNQFEKAINIALQGAQLAPNRAEFYTVVADSYLKMNQFQNAIPYFHAARHCKNPEKNGAYRGALFAMEDVYGKYPLAQLIRVYVNVGQMHDAMAMMELLNAGWPEDPETKLLKVEIDRIGQQVTAMASGSVSTAKKTEDIVISCPGGLYEWDEEIWKTKGIGGSETAAVCMARSLHNKTGRKVVIFNGPREKTTEIDGVVYMPAGQMGNYLLENEPKVHIAWRHNMKVTNAPTYLWCHDLMAQGIENHANYKKVITLSPFAKSFLRGLFALPDEKLWVSRNGVTLDRFADISTIKKVPGKIIFSSSPDRGLDRVIKVLDEVVKTHPNIQLHCFYGFDNMMKMGKAAEVERFTKLINERPWVIMHGNISQKDLTRHMAESCVWLYPTNFLETFCITAVEAAICGAYPVVRDYGAVPQTLSGVPATIIEESGSDDELTKYVVAVKEALTHKWWEQMRVSPEKYSWDSVADEWIAEMQL